MPIVSSLWLTDSAPQRGGGRWTVERHTDSKGRVHTVGPYLWDGAANRDALLSARAAQIDGQLEESEAAALLSDTRALPALVHLTKAKLAALFWATLQTAQADGRKVDACRLIWWAYQRIQDGSITSDQLRQSYNAFFGKSLSVAQWNSLVTTRFVPARDRYQAILDEGEF